MYTLSLGCSFITLREPCNNQRPRYDITWLHVTNHLYHSFPLDCLNIWVVSSNSENCGMNITEISKPSKPKVMKIDKGYVLGSQFQ